MKSAFSNIEEPKGKDQEKDAAKEKEKKEAEQSMVSIGEDASLHGQINKANVFDMGFWDKRKLSKEASSAIAKRVGAVATQMVEQQKMEICHRLTLDLDVKKKQAYLEYMSRIFNVNSEVSELSNKMVSDLTDLMLNERFKINEDREKWLAKTDKLPETVKEKEKAEIEKWFDTCLEEAKRKTVRFIETHAASLEETLRLLVEEKVGNNKRTIGAS